jgi:hypothetical protein
VTAANHFFPKATYQQPIAMAPTVIKNQGPAHGPLFKNGTSGHVDEPTKQSAVYEKTPNTKHARPPKRSDLNGFTGMP